MAAMLSSAIVLAVGGFLGLALAAPEQGIWFFDITKVDEKGVTKPYYKSLFNNSQIWLSVICQNSELVPITIQWMLRHTSCANEYLLIEEEQALVYMKTVHQPHTAGYPYKATKFLESEILLNCSKDHHEIIPPFKYTVPNVIVYDVPEKEKLKDKEKNAADKEASDEKKDSESNKNETPKQASKVQGEGKTSAPTRRKRADDQHKAEASKNTVTSGGKGSDDKATTDTEPVDKKKEGKGGESVPVKDDKTSEGKGSKELVINKPSAEEQKGLVQVWEDGYYLFVLRFLLKNPTEVKDVDIHVTVQMRYGNSYLSAVEWPLLIFYGVMGLVYIFYGIFWLVMLACNWRDLLRVQFWIGGVIFLGMLEKAVFFGEYESINNTGQSVKGAIIIAELVSCLKRMLARMLVIIVSLGYGIVKPRLGQTFHKVLFVGVVFFILASIEGCSRALSGRADQSMKLLVASIPLAVTDSVICWWIFSSLLQTTRTLRLRRNVVKLSLYRHFTNTLIFSVIASVAYMIWFMTQHRLKDCITDWKELWIDDAFWHLLFSVILFVIMILWRPSANNQRYAFSPLLDAADDDMDDEQTLTEAYEGMKMRSTNSLQKNGSPRVKDDYREDDLKWVEDNIPSSLADRVLPALDSDEEIMNTKFEVSKME